MPFRNLAFAIASTVFATAAVTPAAAEPCGFYNVRSISDAPDDQSAGAPSYVDVRKVEIRQVGARVQFVWEANGTVRNEDKQYFFLVFDTDNDARTGQNWGGAGGELKITVSRVAALIYFGPAGNVLREETVPVVFEGNRFVLTIDASKIPGRNFRFYFESSGETPHYDRGSLVSVSLEPPREESYLVLEPAERALFSANPALVKLPRKGVPVQLNAYSVSGTTKTLLPADAVRYTVEHPVKRISDPSAIVSVDPAGRATYLSEGYVFVTAYSTSCSTTSARLIIATGEMYGDPVNDRAVAVFPPDYVPQGSRFSFAEVMARHPNYMRTVNLAYDITRELYGGYVPFGGERQILAPLVLEGHCGGNMNPLETAPCCYMNCSDGTPQYNVIVHEIGHNFAYSRGMVELLQANNSRIGNGGFMECVASLPVIYMAARINKAGPSYGVHPASFEARYYEEFLRNDVPYARSRMNDFEALVRAGQTSGVFDPQATFDRVSTMCSFFQLYAYDLTTDANPHHEEVIPRFLSLFGDTPPPEFVPEKVDTYFAAAYSAAVGQDMRSRLRLWGFTIDDGYFQRLYAGLSSKLDRPNQRKRAVRH